MTSKNLYISLLALLFTSCATEMETSYVSDVPQSLYATPSNIMIDDHDMCATTYIMARNTAWSLGDIPSWLTVSDISGNTSKTISFTANENTSVEESRIATLTLQPTNVTFPYQQHIRIAQNPSEAYALPDINSFTCNPTETSKKITIISNAIWDVQVSDENWINAKKSDNNTLSITITENLSKERTGSIYIQYKGRTLSTITVTQSDADVTCNEETIAFDVTGGNKTLSINAEASWTATTSQSWLEVTPRSGKAGTANLTITATTNSAPISRSGFVYVKIGTQTKLSIAVNQDRVSITTSDKSLSFDSGVESYTFTVISNIRWNILDCPEWLTLSSTSGEAGSTTITATSNDNPNTTPRSSRISIGQSGQTAACGIDVQQAGKRFNTDPNSLTFPYTQATQTIHINTNGTWVASVSESWLHLDKTSGSGSYTLSITVDDNPNKDERKGYVYIQVGDSKRAQTVTQIGRYIQIDCNDVIQYSTPTVVNISVSSNQAWTATTDVAWMTPNPTSGSNNSEVKVSITDNPSVNSRCGNITISTASEDKVLTFTQPGRTLTLDCAAFEFIAAGGTSTPVIITTDGTYAITTSDEWITISQTSNTFTVTVNKNESSEIRYGSVSVAITNLAEGESLIRTISISQYPQRAQIDKDTYDEDENWN